MSKRPVRPEAWLTETLLSLHLSLDFSVGSPGVRLHGVIPGRKGMLSYHWPTVQRKLSVAQVDDLAAQTAELVRARLLTAGLLADELAME